MKFLHPNETLLQGSWLEQDGRFIADEAGNRIEWLVDQHLHLLGTSADGWESIYRDPTDDRLWLKTFPNSGMHGGGPAELKCVNVNTAREIIGEIPAI